jgi:glycosyltransferase involved in cell wall biosynthesis
MGTSRMRRIVAFGPGPQFKGGIANYNTSLARALDRHEEVEVHIVSWTQQYPAIIPRDYIDRKSREDKLAGTRVKTHYLLNYNRPGTWGRTVRFIRSLQPDLVVIQWAIAIQGIPLRYLARKLQKAGIRVYFDLHFVIQKENSSLDMRLTRKCIQYGDAYVVHAMKTFNELKELLPGKDYRLCQPGEPPGPEGIPVLKLYHPVYDMFRKDDQFDPEQFKTSLGLKKHVFLFFGFIRKYKGLHNAIEAFNLVRKERDDVSLLVVGELFWDTLDSRKLSTRIKNVVFGIAKKVFLKKQDDERNYRPLELISAYGLEEDVVTHTEFVPNEDVHLYWQASDSILLFYLTATPSGVESMAYNFGKPILATRVGHFPETIQPGHNGYLADPDDPSSMAEIMLQSIDQPISERNVYATAKEMSWEKYASSILAL